MWHRFTERARKIVFHAQEAARENNDDYVSTEHLLLGILAEPDCLAFKMLIELGISPKGVKALIQNAIVHGAGNTAKDLTLTPRAKRVIDLAYDEARSYNQDYLGTEHILIGLMREGDGLAGRSLAKAGLEIEALRRLMNVKLNAQALFSNRIQKSESIGINRAPIAPPPSKIAPAPTPTPWPVIQVSTNIPNKTSDLKQKPVEKSKKPTVTIGERYTNSKFASTGAFEAVQYNFETDEVLLIHESADDPNQLTALVAVVALKDFNQDWRVC